MQPTHGTRRASSSARWLVAFGCAAIIVFSAPTVLAQTAFNWDNGGGDGLWGTSANWAPNGVPDFDDNLNLTAASLAGAQTINLAGTRSISALQANGVSGTYTFANSVAGGTLDIFGAAEMTVIFTNTATGSLIFDTDIRYRVDGRFFVNSSPTGGKITFNAGRTISSGAASGTSILNLTSRNTTLDYAIEVHSTIADGPGARIALEAGFAGDADAHIGHVMVDGLNTYTGPTSVNGMTLAFNSIGNIGGGPSALGAPTTLADATISLGTNATTPNNVAGTLRYVGTAPAGHSSNRPFQFVGFSPGGTIESSGAGPLVLSGGLTSTQSSSVRRSLRLGGTNTGDNIFSGVIQDVPGAGLQDLVKNGPGKWSLTAANTYLGTTTVNDGILVVGPGGAIGAGGTASTVSINGPGTLRLDGGSITTTDLDRTATGSLEFRSGTLTVAGPAGSSFAGAQTLDVGTAGAGTFRFSGGTFATTNLTINGADDTVNLSGGVLSTGNLNNSNGGTFTLAPAGSLILSNPAGQLTTGAGAIAGSITGQGGLTKSGPGVLEITSSLAYMGPTTVNQGTLRLAPAARLADSTAVTVNSPGVLELDAAPNTIFSLDGTGTVNFLNNALLAVGNFGNAGGTGTFSGVIQGDGDLAKRGIGTLTLTGNNTYLGSTAVAEGALVINSIANLAAPSALGSPATAADGTIALGNASTGGTLRYVGTSPAGHSSNRAIHLAGVTGGGGIEASGAGPLVLSGGITAAANFKALQLTGSNTGDNTIAGPIAGGAGGLTLLKSGPGKWVLTAPNTYAGATDVSGGELVVRGPAAVITGSGAVRVGPGGTLTLDGGTISTPVADVEGTFNFRSGTLVLGTGSHSFDGDLAIGTHGLGAMTITPVGGSSTFDTLTVHGPDDSLTIGGGSTGMDALDNSHGGTFNFTGGTVSMLGGQLTTASGTLGGIIRGSGGLTKVGNGALTVASAANDYSGPTLVRAGRLVIAPTALLPDATTVTVDPGAVLEYAAGTADAIFGLNGGGTVDTARLLVLGNSTGPGTLGGVGTFGGAISGAGSLEKRGIGTFTLAGNATYSGPTEIEDGTVILTGSMVGTSGVSVIEGPLAGRATLTINGGTLATPGVLTADAPLAALNLNGGSITARQLDLAAAAGNYVSSFNWTAGTIRLTGPDGVNISEGLGNANKPFRSDLTLGAGKTLIVDGLTVVGDNGMLEIDGGTLATAGLSSSSGGQISFIAGTLRLTQDQTFSPIHAGNIDVDSPLGPARTLEVLGSATIDAPITLAGGTFTANSLVNPHNLILDSGTLNVTAGALAVPAGATIDASSGMTINATGGLAVPATAQFNAIGAALNATAASSNAGDINAINSTLTFTGGLANTGRLRLIDTTVNGPVTLGAAPVDVAGTATFNGPVSGAAPFAGSSGTVIFKGGYSPGNSPAAVPFAGGLVLGDTNVLRMELGGAARGDQYDGIDVAGNAAFAGTLNVTLVNGFAPRPLDSFDIVRFATSSGSFDAYTGLDIPGPLALAPLLDADTFRLVATLPGDADADGTVNFTDLVALAQNYNTTDGSATWRTGDFNYDGNVTFPDLVAMAQNYNLSALPSAGALPPLFEEQWHQSLAHAAAVPEPTALLSIVASVILLQRRRR